MLNTIKNENIKSFQWEEDNEERKNLFIFSVGYEERSLTIYDKFITNSNILKICFLFSDWTKHNSAKKHKEKLDNYKIKPITVELTDSKLISDTIIQKLKQLLQATTKEINIHIDYSSMPRNWYCNIPYKINKFLRPEDRVFFWYSEGDYPKKAERWSSAGIEDVEVFSGKSSSEPDNKRNHIFGIGFDAIRTQSIYSVLDPSYLVVTYSYPTDYGEMREVILNVNKDLISTAAFTSALPTENFSFSISKLYEIVKELSFEGDVILVPDGPKPQILAYSLIPLLFNKAGVSCLHVKRHPQFYKPLNVKPRGRIFGFSYSVE
jgi:hypothetical protein